MLIPSVRKSWHDTPAIYTRLCLHVCSIHVCTCMCVCCCRWWHPIVFLTSDRITTVTVPFTHSFLPPFISNLRLTRWLLCLHVFLLFAPLSRPYRCTNSSFKCITVDWVFTQLLMNKHSFIVWVKQQERAAKIGTLCSAQGYHFITIIPQCELDCTILCTEGRETFWWSLGDKIVSDLWPQTTFHSKTPQIAYKNQVDLQ